jgi:hypothetical protein
VPPATGDDQLLGQLVHKFQCARAGRVSLRPRHGFPALPAGISSAPSLSCGAQAISAQVPRTDRPHRYRRQCALEHCERCSRRVTAARRR